MLLVRAAENHELLLRTSSATGDSVLREDNVLTRGQVAAINLDHKSADPSSMMLLQNAVVKANW